MQQRHRDDVGGGTLALWGAVGLGVGFLAGFFASEWAGSVNRPRLKRAARGVARGVAKRFTQATEPALRALSASAGARAARAAFDNDTILAALGLDVLPIGMGAVELRGWVDTRAARARAARIARAVPGIERVNNRILVRGEDDPHPFPESSASDQTA